MRTIKVNNKGERIINKEVVKRMKEIIYLPDTLPMSEEARQERIKDLNLRIGNCLNIDLNEAQQDYTPQARKGLLFGTELDYKIRRVGSIYENYKNKRKSVSSKKRLLNQRKEMILKTILDDTYDGAYTEQVFPEVLIHLEKVYDTKYKPINEAYKRYTDLMKHYKEELDKLRIEKTMEPENAPRFNLKTYYETHNA